MTNELPKVGVALTQPFLKSHCDWIKDEKRDLEMQDFIYVEKLLNPTKPVAEIKAMLDGFEGRLTLHGPFFGFKIDCPDPGIVPVVQDRLLKCLDICAELKADQMVVHSPVTSWDNPNHAAFPEYKLRQIACTTNLMKPVVARAAEYGVCLVLENIEDIDPAARVNLARELNDGKDTVKVSLDTGHAFYAHKTTDAPPVDAYVSIAGADLHHIHLQDADGYADRHWHPGDGELNWRAIFAAIARLPQTPRLIIEVRDQAGVRRGVDHLRAAGLAL
ncbi:sugar phosphate isomerase/epimerase family protein [Chelatococcus asaccharovorans]|uniref:Sugar phosphate isomerase/epimerase n=1 Tax=Chelatococcus asaccharovorans TaxID=28210 RepID=A0A2V3UHC7_9HYPH|nr:sugar phosphate isomerase/epimerase family protein [Chelatococcus asaccharovorans]MBS7701764.1 sugar phosphate isomerase/epimerase [Chelatococcus asaccharovorans]PXW64529.1 sugar phosphate isomerase/epimerase [Chelatococcus asaccharovorans]